MQARISWRGGPLGEELRAATVAAMADTLKAAADRARADHPGWKTRTGEAERSVAVEPPRRDGTHISGRVVDRARHFPFLERGTRYMRASRTLERAGEREFPRLARRIEAHARSAK